MAGPRSVIRNGADWAPAALVTTGVALACIGVASNLTGAPLIALWVISLAFRSVAPVHQHCHAHLKLFRVTVFNHVYDVILMLAAGNVTAVWELQHVLGHHLSYLGGTDPAAVDRFGTGRGQRLRFTLLGDALSFTDALAIAAGRVAARRRLIGQQLLQLGVLGALLAYDPMRTLGFVVVPWLLLRWLVFWTSFAQHHAVPRTNVYSGSVTRFGLSNVLYLNVGHHTAHHEKPTLHWTKLPARTAHILKRIPSSCLR